MPALRSQALVKTRASCDRCHSQKLRCEKALGLSKCRRCDRLGALCRYSPRNARKQPHLPPDTLPGANPDTPLSSSQITGSSPVQQNLETESGSADLIFSPCFLDKPSGHHSEPWHIPWEGCCDNTSISDVLFDNVLPWDMTLSPLVPVPCPLWTTPSSPGQTQNVERNPREKNAWLRLDEKFNRISIRARECALPLRLSQASDSAQGAESDIAADEKRKALTLILDDLFTLTKDFIDALDTVASFSFTSVPFNEGSCPYAPFTASSTTPRQALLTDYESLVSCYTWLEKMHTAILCMMRACVLHSASPSLEKGVAIALPKIEISGVPVPGMYVGLRDYVPSRVTTSLYMNTISAVMSQLWTRMAIVMGHLVVEVGGNSPWKFISDGINRLVVGVTELRSLL